MSDTAAPPVESDVVTKLSAHSVTDTVSSLTALLGAKGMKVFAVIDQSAEAGAVGLDLRPTVLVIFGNPTGGTAIMDAAPLAALDLPLKILVWADGGQTRVSYLAPSTLADRYGLDPSLARNLEGIEPLIDAVVSP